MNVKLVWSDPFRFSEASFEDLDRRVPAGPGVYLWVVGTEEVRRVSYVGETMDLRWRQREHVRGTLGGQYYLYDPASLRSAEQPVPWYSANGFEDAWGGSRTFDAFVKVALENLEAYEVVWAELDASKETLRAVESAIVHALFQQREGAGRALVNTGVSVRPENTGLVEVSMEWPEDGSRVEGLDGPMTYGSLVADRADG
jgi:hypothetical protein